ncbi:MAG TPA: type III-A CRISPR-associated protein Csm2 [Niabella sp.]|nr:type III-A CRISPR-associated protein Csm2 [Agriterribacter sp.]HUN01621.1 type III-A CRISPR-associated protein Csm2 [Niabella sp.]
MSSYQGRSRQGGPGGKGWQQNSPQGVMPIKKPSDIDKNIINEGINNSHIENLKAWGEYFANDSGGKKVSTSQLRKFFGEIKRIQADFENGKMDLVLLDPKIAYAVGRAKKDSGKSHRVKIEDFYNQISPLIGQIGYDKKKFKHFVQLCEAIVAYHKHFGGDS